MAMQLIQEKVFSIDELANIVAHLKAEGRTVVQCHGVFDLLHPGHIRHLKAARDFGDVLVVTLTRDEHVNKGPGRPVFNQRLRAESLAALDSVDYVAVNRWPTAIEAISLIKPDFYVKGSDYAESSNDLTGKINDEIAAVHAAGGQVRFTDDITFSSTQLLNSHFAVYPEPAEVFLREFRQRFGAEDVISRLKALKGLRVLVVGDTIIDEYHYCRPLGMSSKDTFLATKYLEAEVFAGGVLAAANHLAGFCDEVEVVTCLGPDDAGESVARKQLGANVKASIFYRTGVPTPVKRRFVEPGFYRKMFEVCYLDDTPMPPTVESEISSYLAGRAQDYDLVLLTDFGHGFVTPAISDVLCKRAPFLAINAQTNSANSGFNLITKYGRADYVCIDEPEVRLAMADRFGDLRVMTERVAGQLQCDQVSVTRGSRGAVTYSAREGYFEIPVFSNKVLDTVGAGDAYLAVTAPCVAAGFPMELVGFIGNAVGALAVQIVGNRSSVDPASLFKSISAMLH
jgi:rfaE bifunctional protein nucleotidyltransferase chain/domain